MALRKEVVNHIEQNIYPQYDKNDTAHQLDHIKYVTTRSLNFAANNEADEEMAYVIAAYHDLGCAIDRETHEMISAKILREDSVISRYFTSEQINTMAEAIEDHRASCDHVPRSIYGKIISTADRDTSYENLIRRVWKYNSANHSDSTNREIAEFARGHIIKKFGREGYAKKRIYFNDPDFDAMCKSAEAAVYGTLNHFIEEIKKYVEDADMFSWCSRVFEDLPQYAIDRDDFTSIFGELDLYACDGRLPYEGPDFRFWSFEDEVYMLHKPSGTIINWYKIGHTGRTNTCNKTLTLDEYREFAEMLINEIKEHGGTNYKW